MIKYLRINLIISLLLLLMISLLIDWEELTETFNERFYGKKVQTLEKAKRS